VRIHTLVAAVVAALLPVGPGASIARPISWLLVQQPIEVGSTVVTTADTDLRSAPSTSASVVVTLAQGTPLTVIAPSQTGDGVVWWPVQDPATGNIGFVREDVLTAADAGAPATVAQPGQSESERAEELLIDHGLRTERPMTETVIVRSATTTVDDPAFQTTVENVTDALRADPEIVAGATNYYELAAQAVPQAAGLVSADRKTTLIPVTLAGDRATAVENAPDFMAILEGQRAAAAGFEILTVGDASISLAPIAGDSAGDPCRPISESYPPDSEVVRALEILYMDFAAGMVAPVEIVVDGPMDDPAVRAGIDQLVQALTAERTADDQPLFGPATVTTRPDGQLALISVPLKVGPCSPEALDAIRRVRDDLVPPAEAAMPGTEILVTGQAALILDHQQAPTVQHLATDAA
jgi:hypothetical protein